ncbi:MAG TPA: helix-turn-helix transcriptional regulator [Clostridia bacterium]|nr:helix-turn-helix transcriptional regulator [Clostridia bacterium]
MKALGHLCVETIQLSPGQEWADEANAWRFVRLDSGSAYWLDTAKPRLLVEKEMLVVHPSQKAVIRASQLSPVELQAFAFAPDLLYGFFTLAERHCFETNGNSKSPPVQFLPSTHPLTQRFAALVSRPRQDPEMVRRAEVLGLAVAFFGDGLVGKPPEDGRNCSTHEKFYQIISRMPDLELIQHTPEQLARLCGCSPRHFNRLFRDHFGQSPRARQTELRLLKARQLLMSTDQKIIQVALDSGYRSLSLFNSLFKRRFGMSPSVWRSYAAKE